MAKSKIFKFPFGMSYALYPWLVTVELNSNLDVFLTEIDGVDHPVSYFLGKLERKSSKPTGWFAIQPSTLKIPTLVNIAFPSQELACLYLVGMHFTLRYFHPGFED